MKKTTSSIWRTLAFKLFVMLLAFATVPGGVVAWWTLEHMEASRSTATLKAMDAVVAAKADAIEQFMGDRRANVERIAGLVAGRVQTLHDALDRSDEPPPVEELPVLTDGEGVQAAPPAGDAPDEEEGEGAPEGANDDESPREEETATPASVLREAEVADAQGQLRRVLGLVLWDRSEFEELLVIGPEGDVRVSTFEGHENRDASSVGYFQQGLRGTFLQPVFLSPITERYTMVVSTPIYSAEREVIGVLAARLNLERFFMIVTESEGLGETGETIAAELVDGDVVLRAPTRHDPDSGPGTVLVQQDLPAAAAARGESGRGKALDLRDHEVYAAWRHLGELGWGLVVKIDVIEALEPVTELQNALWLTFLLVVVVAALVAFVAAGTVVRPIRQLRSAADRISRGDLAVEVGRLVPRRGRGAGGELRTDAGGDPLLPGTRRLRANGGRRGGHPPRDRGRRGSRTRGRLRPQMTTLYERILDTARDFMGPAAEEYIRRRIRIVMRGEEPEAIHSDKLERLAAGIAMTANGYMSPTRSERFQKAVLALADEEG